MSSDFLFRHEGDPDEPNNETDGSNISAEQFLLEKIGEVVDQFAQITGQDGLFYEFSLMTKEQKEARESPLFQPEHLKVIMEPIDTALSAIYESVMNVKKSLFPAFHVAKFTKTDTEPVLGRLSELNGILDKVMELMQIARWMGTDVHVQAQMRQSIQEAREIRNKTRQLPPKNE